MRPVNRNNKKNIYCFHCQHWTGWIHETCRLNGKKKNYWNRCKGFEWHKRYLEADHV